MQEEINKKNRRRNNWIFAVIVVLVVVGVIYINSNQSNSDQSDSGGSVFSRVFNKKSDTNKLYDSDLVLEEIVEGQDQEEGKMILSLPIKATIQGSNDPVNTSSGYNHELLLKSIQEAAVNDDIVGILLDIDSGGGTVYHSSELYEALMELKSLKDIPIYTSIGSTGASGAYYIACASDRIYSGVESTIGSIGVIAQRLDARDLMEKIGVKYDVFKTGDYKDTGAFYKDLSDKEKTYLENSVNRSYDRFVDIVSSQRKLDKKSTLELADGRTFDGLESVENGLVDQIGTRMDVYLDLCDQVGGEYDLVEFKYKASDAFKSLLPDSIRDLVSINDVDQSQASQWLDLLERIEEMGQVKIMYYYGG